MPEANDSGPSAAVKADIAIAAIEGGSSIEETARSHGVSVEAVTRWQHELRARAAELFGDSADARGQPSSEISESRVGAVLDSLFMFVGVLELDGTLIQANAAPLAAAAIRSEDVVGKKFWDCYWWDYGDERSAPRCGTSVPAPPAARRSATTYPCAWPATAE